uniref:Protein transport protein Sec61 subunit gamma n=1 Tax=Oryza punctata TaxID=4537 RepID=A0A0E0JWB8_ORYPU
MDAVDSVVDPLREFAKDSVRLVKRCHKPDRKGKRQIPIPLEASDGAPDLMFVWRLLAEFTKVAARTAIGFVVMGFVGFFVKLIFIPINNIIVGSG